MLPWATITNCTIALSLPATTRYQVACENGFERFLLLPFRMPGSQHFDMVEGESTEIRAQANQVG
jgi:hypothetical protein